MPRVAAGLSALVLASLALAPGAGAQTAASGAFDLSAPFGAYPALTHRQLAEHNVMQSFGFDEANKTILVVQTRRGHRDDGGLLVNRFTYAGKRLDTMTLDGFGHGTSIGVTHGAATYLWVESGAKANDHGTSEGTHVTRLPYRAGGTATPTSAGSIDVTPPQAVNQSPVPQIDRVSGNLIVRIAAPGGLWRFLSVPQADAVAHRWNRVAVLGSTPSKGSASPQGYAVNGGYAYLNYGTSGKPNGYVRKVPLNPRVVTAGTSTPENVFPGVESREPEGIAVQAYDGAHPRLWIGVGSRQGDDTTFVNLALTSRYVLSPAAAPPAAPAPAPAGPVAALRVRAVKISRTKFVRTHRIPVRVGGVDTVARVRILARYKRRGHRSRVVSIYAGQRRVRAASRTIGLKLTKRQFRRLRAVHGRTRLAIAVRAGAQRRTVHETVPRPGRHRR